ncbi:ATP-binding cassette domain-containing protein [Lactobacillus curvatus]|nr:ATP-binding cassette domain-containing protein [Latilactobacillus curvatus]
MLNLQHIHYAYSQSDSLNDISLTIDAGEAVAFMGPNGSGKSTLFKLISGLIQPSAGQYYFKDQLVDARFLKKPAQATTLHRAIGFVFQNSDVQLFNETVRAELAFGPEQMGRDSDEVQRRVDDCLALLQIEKLADRVPYQLSGGEKKLVALGSVLTMNPEMIVLDEPFNGLSAAYQSLLIRLLQQLNAAGKGILIASHNLAQIKQVAKRLVVFNENHQITDDLPLAKLEQEPKLQQNLALL